MPIIDILLILDIKFTEIPETSERKRKRKEISKRAIHKLKD